MVTFSPNDAALRDSVATLIRTNKMAVCSTLSLAGLGDCEVAANMGLHPRTRLEPTELCSQCRLSSLTYDTP